ncbi:MAG: DegT/DnrJ/EryC1/StrS aminotransferase family protein [Deltaproteobacteria bacterium]|nr:DegT/DnrJ/EryC1/StrS aminotransferase family protein [Deltaproteobacteria bacterium]
MDNIPFGKPVIGQQEIDAVTEVLRSGILVHGPKTKQFEESFSLFTKAPYSLSVASCTAALHLTYFYSSLKPGDEVIVPAQTHTATAHAVEFCGAKPVFVDAERKTGNIDIDQIEAAITNRTKAISVVHFLGMPVDMTRVCSIAAKYHLLVVEDCALATGTYVKGVHAGLLGDVGCFSFYPVKHMTTAEGGMLITKDDKLAATVRYTRAFGVDRVVGERAVPGVYDVTMLGYNYRMNEVAAALGIEQLKRLPDILAVRERNYNLLESCLKDIDELTLLQSSHGDFVSSHYCLSAMLNDRLTPKRVDIIEGLKARGFGSSVYYPHPVPHLTYYSEKYGYSIDSSFPVASWISNSSVALPVGPHLSEEDIVNLANAVKDIIIRV